jgi:hypothetical protein
VGPSGGAQAYIYRLNGAALCDEAHADGACDP